MEELKDEIRTMISQVAEVDIDEIGDATHLANELRLDSMQALDLLVNLERKYGITIPEDELNKFVSVNSLAGLVSDLMAVVQR